MAFVTTKEEPKPPHLVLPPRSSYQRLIAYRLAARFKLQKANAAQEREAIVSAGMDPATTIGGEKREKKPRSVGALFSCVRGDVPTMWFVFPMYHGVCVPRSVRLFLVHACAVMVHIPWVLCSVRLF